MKQSNQHNWKAFIATESYPFGLNRRQYKYSCLLVFPEEYTVGISNLGHQLIWKAINDRDRWMCDRIYHTNGSAIRYSMERELYHHEFNIIAFSLYYETNLIHMIDFLRFAQIGPNHRFPERKQLLIAGGPLTDIIPELLLDYVDVVFQGNAYQAVLAFIELYENHQLSPQDLFASLSHVPGVCLSPYICEKYGINFSDVVRDEISFAPSKRCILSPIISSSSLFPNTALINIAEGCPHHCTFCYIGKYGKPYRYFPTDTIIDSLDHIAKHTDIRRAGLVSAAVGAHPDIDSICAAAIERNISLTLSSVRAEDVTDIMMQTLSQSGTNTITLAPEAGSATMRKLLGKGALTEKVLVDVIARSQQYKLSNVKLYFMIGLPYETMDDIIAIVTLVKKCRDVLLQIKQSPSRMGRIIVNLSVFVPKPKTPLFCKREFCPPKNAVKQSVQLLKKELMKVGGIDFRPPSFIEALIQSTLDTNPDQGRKVLKLLYDESLGWREALQKTKHNLG